ncbi:MAG: DUF1549 domain-containing protein, partial [Limisphaerales bacterium]
EYAKHWAYVAPKKAVAPKAVQSGFTQNNIDQFVLAQMKAKGFTPAKAADKRSLIRRVSFDLTGLPPTWAQVQAFVDDASPNAYEKLVDRLMASPQYGERMAVFWLDQVRYADTMGYHSDNDQTKPLYRDYVIDSFNKNIPFDRFTKEQVAGDLLKNRTREQLIASGYNRLNMTTREGGAQPKEYTSKYLADRVRNASTVWMASTLGCSECHDHKFDPFSTKDFYSFGAFFADLEETPVGAQKYISVPGTGQKAEVAALREKLPALEKALNAVTPEMDAALARWEKTQVRWTMLRPTKPASQQGAALKVQPDQSILVSGKSPDSDVYTMTLSSVPAGTRAFRIEVLPHKSLPKKGPGRAGNGNFVLTEVVVKIGDKIIPLRNATASFEQTLSNAKNPYKKWNAGSAIDNDAKGTTFGWAVLPKVGVPNRLVFEMEEPLAAAGDLVIVLKQAHGTQHTLGRFQIYGTEHSGNVTANSAAPPINIIAILAIA